MFVPMWAYWRSSTTVNSMDMFGTRLYVLARFTSNTSVSNVVAFMALVISLIFEVVFAAKKGSSHFLLAISYSWYGNIYPVLL